MSSRCAMVVPRLVQKRPVHARRLAPPIAWAPPRAPPHRPPASAVPGGQAAVYRRRRPTATPLYPIVRHHLETFLARAAEADPWGEGVMGWVEDDFQEAPPLLSDAWEASPYGRKASLGM